MPATPIGGPGEDNSINNANSIAANPKSTASAPLAELCAQVDEKLQAFLNAEPATERIQAVQEQSRRSLEVIDEALTSYNQDELSLSYNGGKDCLVLLILYLSALHQHFAKPNLINSINHSKPAHPAQMPSTLPSVYIISQHPFKEVDYFVDSSVDHYYLDLARYAKSMKEAFTDYIHDHPHVRAIFVGTRRTDPHGAKLKFFDPTDRGWPDFMRIHPVIDWHYAEIWTFIRELEIPYCDLYDKGYTSLGGTTDTHPNPALKSSGVDEEFRPAYELIDDDEERLGRDR